MIIVGVIDARTFWRYLVSSYYIAKDKYFKCSTIDTRIGAIVPLYSVFVSKEDKSKWVSNLFSWSIWNDCYAFIWARVYKPCDFIQACGSDWSKLGLLNC